VTAVKISIILREEKPLKLVFKLSRIMERDNEGQCPTQTIILAHNRNKTADCEDIDHRSYAQLKLL